MPELKGRISLRYDTLTAWQDETKQAEGKGAYLVLNAGEVAFTAVPKGSAAEQTTPPAVLFKVGDGTTAFKYLPWASALAADVYSWAKAATPQAIIDEARKGLISADSVVKTLNGLKGDITLETAAGETRLVIDKSGQKITLALNFTDGEKAALASGITATKVAAYDEYATSKQDTIDPTHKLSHELVSGLGTAATKDVDAFDVKGAAAAVLGESTDVSTKNTVYGAKKAADEALTAAKAAKTTADSKADASEFNTFKSTTETSIDNLQGTVATNTSNISKNATAISKLETAVKSGITFKGKVDSLPATTSYSNGDLIIVNKKEYILYESGATKKWIELGDEGSHLTKETADDYYVAKNAAITGGTACKITYDAKGLVIKGEGLKDTDIPDLAASKIISGTLPDARIASAETWNAKQNALTTEQLAAANSGITKAKVDTYDAYATTLDGLGAAAKKGVDTSIAANSTSANLPTTAAVEARINAHKGIDKEGTVTSVSVGEGLVVSGDKTVAPTISFSTENVFTWNCGSATKVI